MMNHPYQIYEKTHIWKIVEKAIFELIENQDIELKTNEKYVIGYITQQVVNENEKKYDFKTKT